VKTCVLCKYFSFTPSMQGYSEMTPGCDASWGCYKNRWNEADWDCRQDVAKAFATAETCKYYEVEP
jgi:hypothetical protein